MATTTKRHELFRAPQRGHDVHHGGLAADPRKTLETACRIHLGWAEERAEPTQYEPHGRQLNFNTIMPADLNISDLETAVTTLRAQAAKIEADNRKAIEAARAAFAEWKVDAVAVAQAALTLLQEHADNEVLAELVPVAQKKLIEAESSRFVQQDVYVEREPGSLSLVLDACEHELAQQRKVKAARTAELRALLTEAGVSL